MRLATVQGKLVFLIYHEVSHQWLTAWHGRWLWPMGRRLSRHHKNERQLCERSLPNLDMETVDVQNIDHTVLSMLRLRVYVHCPSTSKRCLSTTPTTSLITKRWCLGEFTVSVHQMSPFVVSTTTRQADSSKGDPTRLRSWSCIIILLGECSALWASVSEALCMVGVYVSSHRKLIGHIG